MRKATLTRIETSAQGTFGSFVTDSGLTLASGELPWHDNQHKISCIPAGTYTCIWHQSPSKGWVYQVTNVENRDDILIHVANFCGDVSQGFKSDVEGCIGLGSGMGELDGQKAIVASQKAIAAFEADMAQEDFILVIKN